MCAGDEKSNGQVYNVGGEKACTLHQLAELLVEVNGGGQFTVKTFPPERKRIDIGDYYCDWSALHGAVGWEPARAPAGGLGRTIAYYRQHLRRYL